MYVAQQCFGLSDEGIEDAIYDSQAISAFVDIDLKSGVCVGLDDVAEITTPARSQRADEKIFDTINGIDLLRADR